jgi:hypothetical protein
VIKLFSKIKYLLIAGACIAGGCVNPPQYPEIPKIAFVSVSDTLIDQRAIISVTFSFEDGDGDLGVDVPTAGQVV